MFPQQALFTGDSLLEFDSELERARLCLTSYRAPDPQQEMVRRRILEFMARHPRDAHLRSCLEGHLTASALVVEQGSGRVLLMHHRKLQKWLQLGGHCDGDANLPAVALREAIEESGISDLGVLPKAIDVDIHPIPARPNEPAHLHLDTRFIVLAPQGAEPKINHESQDLRWLSVEAALSLGVDESVTRLFKYASGVS